MMIGSVVRSNHLYEYHINDCTDKRDKSKDYSMLFSFEKYGENLLKNILMNEL